MYYTFSILKTNHKREAINHITSRLLYTLKEQHAKTNFSHHILRRITLHHTTLPQEKSVDICVFQKNIVILRIEIRK